MTNKNRVCFACGVKHGYCPSCYDDRLLEPWHIMFEDETCKVVFDTINKLFYKHITENEAIVELKKYDLSKKFNDDLQKEVDRLLEIDKQNQKHKGYKK